MAQEINLGVAQNRTMIRSTFIPKVFKHTGTCNTGELIPLFATIEVMPHETWKIKTNLLIRQQTPLHPTMDQAFADYWWFYVPHMQIWNNWNAFMGEVEDAAWVSQTVYTIPKIIIPSTGVDKNSLISRFKMPLNVGGFNLGALKLRAYNHICNQWFRDQNVSEPISFYTDDTTITYSKDGDWTVGGKPYTVNRKADYFSTALPEPQKVADITLPLGLTAPVSAGATVSNEYENPIIWINEQNETVGNDGNIQGIAVGINTFGQSTTGAPGSAGILYQPITAGNLYADLKEASAIDINTIRESARMQQIFETDARAGTRAPEMLWARWGVEVDDIQLQRPRLLDARGISLNIHQVNQTSETTSNSPLGDLAGFGYTIEYGDWATHSFKYAGTLMCLMAIRTERTYQQGINKEDLKFDRFDFWHPEFAGEGDQPVYTAELYANADTINNKTIFGYVERGAEYRNFPSMISGEMRTDSEDEDGNSNTLDSWHYADWYDSEPTLSNDWMKEPVVNVDRTIAVQSTLSNQWLFNCAIEFEITRAMPVRSVPGIDVL